MTIGERLEAYRFKLGGGRPARWDEVAAELGVSRQTLHNLRSGLTDGSEDTVERLMLALGISLRAVRKSIQLARVARMTQE